MTPRALPSRFPPALPPGISRDDALDLIADAYERCAPTASEYWAQIGQEMLRRRREREARARVESDLARVRNEHQGTDRIARASRYLARCDAGASGEERNPKAWGAVLRTVRGFALTEHEAMALFEREYVMRCSPRLPSRELRGMVRRAMRCSRPEWGGKLGGAR